MNVLNRLFGRKEASGNVAKNRLQFVLVHDRVNLSPGKMDQLKDDLIQVISKYVEIDREHMDISLTREDDQNLLIANIPLVEMRQK